MSQTFNIYCDESCHLENDGQNAMALGAIWLPKEKTKEIAIRLREIKEQHGLGKHFEMKWTKVSPAKLDFYLRAIDYFFDDDDLRFRCVVVPDKAVLDHKKFKQTHDDWYYKMYFNLLKVIFRPDDRYRIFLDIKDTQGGKKVNKLHEVLCNEMYDFDRKIIEKVQLVHSHEVEVLQLADLLIGAFGYLHRGLQTSTAKQAIIARIKERSRYSLQKSTLLKEEKFNILIWQSPEDNVAIA